MKISNKGDGILFFVISLWSKIKNNMVVTSKFDSKGIKYELMLFLVAALMLVGSHLTFARKREIIISLIVVSIAEVVALLIWAIRLKVITVVDQGFEVRRVCFPFLKRFYRFAEFDFYVIEQNEAREGFYLLSQGKRIVSFSSKDKDMVPFSGCSPRGSPPAPAGQPSGSVRRSLPSHSRCPSRS